MTENSLIDHPVISERYFFPRRGKFKNPFIVPTPEGDIACHFSRKYPDGFTLVHFHGNGEIVTDWMGDFVSIIEGFGCNVLLAEFRGYGMSEGQPSFGAILGDVPRIFERAGLEPSRTVLFGRSVGSIPAIRGVALYPEMAGLVLESGIADIMERLVVRLDPAELGVTIEELKNAVMESMDHKKTMGSYKGPVLVMHALQDSLVDVSHGERLFEWSGGKKSIRIFERGDHNTILYANAPEYFSLIGQFLGSLEKDPF